MQRKALVYLNNFNIKTQDAVAIGEQLQNIEALQQLETIQKFR